MQRRLVLTNEGAGHWFRRSLPMDVLRIEPEAQEQPLRWWQREDTHLFMISFGAFFTVFYTFLS